MNKKELNIKKKEFEKLYFTGKYTQKEIAEKIGISKVSIFKWIKDLPATKYIKIRTNLVQELERLSADPQGNEDLIFRYIENLNLLDTMIRKAKYLPSI
ncbi:DNA-binding transcriptional regulator LsrR (DeoR family) [Dysgonomonadaceae bacterium PH5-43]|nr:DNA-binding transcriptional regulator LsrR (DeoR family) [Dysgonomonadaceae bacterium PH5-43]